MPTLDTAQGLLHHVRGEQREMVDFLRQLARYESPASEPALQAAVLGALSEALTGAGYEARLMHKRRGSPVLYASPAKTGRSSSPVQLLLGHCDTVWPLGTVEEMPVESEAGIVRGPGVYDMKGGLVQMVFALRALSALGLEPSVTPVVFVNSDEERGSPDSTRHIRRLARISERAFVMEPSLGPDGKLKTARKGVGKFSVSVEGQASHAGLDPGGGASAILELSYVIQELFALNDSARGITVNVGTVDGGTSPNVVAPTSSAVVDVRVPTAEDARRVEERILSIEAVTPGVRLHVSGRMGRPPMERTLRNQRLWETASRIGGEVDLSLEEATAGGGSDGSTASLYTATLDGLGAVGDGAHAPHEFVYEKAMAERAALLALLVMEPALGKENK